MENPFNGKTFVDSSNSLGEGIGWSAEKISHLNHSFPQPILIFTYPTTTHSV